MKPEQASAEREVVLRAKGITKSFPGVNALTNVDFEVCRGEVVALLGENGAGKSTLIKILSGVYSLDGGTIELEGRSVRFDTPADAKAAGIGIIHQELNYVATVSVAENIYMGEIPKKGMLVDYRAMYAGARNIMARIGIDIDPRMPIGRCSVAQKQLIEIAKVIAADIKVLIMDEPTSALNDVEVENLFAFIRQAASEGLAVIYISHKLDEIFRVAGRVVVLRDGCVTGRLDMADATRERLIATMVGRTLDELYPKTPSRPGEVAIEVRNLTNEALRGVSFTARKGEIFGVYGLLGSGHQDLGAAITGYTVVHAGEILLDSYARSYGIRCYAIRSGWILTEEMRKNNAPRFSEPVKSIYSVFNPWVSFEDCSMAHINIMDKAAAGELPLFAAYYCHADDTVASEPTMDIIKKFRPDLLLRMKSHLPGYAPFMSNQKLKDHTGWTHNHTWRIYV